MACVFAHENAFGDQIEIDLRGSHPALSQVSPLHTFQEGAFWYDPIYARAYTCMGKDWIQRCGEKSSDDWAKRKCTEGDPRCGQVIVCGDCAKICQPGPNGSYRNCQCDKKVFPEVVTSYLRSGDFYGCD
jgi:hypothetical protein